MTGPAIPLKPWSGRRIGPLMLKNKLNYSASASVNVADNALIRNSEINVAPGAEFTVKPRAIINECKLYIQEGAIAVIGENTRLDGIRARVRKPEASLKIGRKCIINSSSIIICDRSIEIGDYVLIAPGVFLTDSQVHSLDWRERREEIDELNLGKWPDLTAKAFKLKIGDDCWLGCSSQVLAPKEGSSEIILGRGTIVGAGAIVKESFPKLFQVIAGVPAKFIRYIDDLDYIDRIYEQNLSGESDRPIVPHGSPSDNSTKEQ